MTNVNGKSDMIPTESETTSTVGNFSHGSRETPATSSSPMELDRSEKARCQHPDMLKNNKGEQQRTGTAYSVCFMAW